MIGSMGTLLGATGSIGGSMVGGSNEPFYSPSGCQAFTTLYAILHTELMLNHKLAMENGYLQKRIGKTQTGVVADQYELTELSKKVLILDGEIQYNKLSESIPEWKRRWYEDDFKL